MSIVLNNFTNNMTDYVLKHNLNASIIQSAVNGLLSDVEALKGAASAGADLDYRLTAFNHLINGGFDFWQRGNSSRPDAWEIENESVGFSVNRESSEKQLNTYSAKTVDSGQLTQQIASNLLLSIESTVSFYFGCYVKTDTVDQARVGIYNGVTTSYSSYHTGDDTWEFLKINFVSTGAIPSEVKFILESAGGTVYWNAAVVIRGNPNAGPIYVANNSTIEMLRVLSLYEIGSENIKGVGYLSMGDRELSRKVNFVAPKTSVPVVSISSEIPTIYDVQAENVTKYGFDLIVTELGGASDTDGFELNDIDWIAEV